MTEVIYKIYCKDEKITDCYVGSTNNFDKRCGEHIKYCNNEKSSKYNYKVYKYIRAHGGFDNFIIEEIIECDESNRYDCEVHYFLKLNSKLNSYWPRRSKKQYRIDNRERLNEENRQRYNDNREQILEQRKQYRIHNREKILERQKQYRINNSEQLSEQQSTKIECECGVSYTYRNKARHYRSQKHLNYISTK